MSIEQMLVAVDVLANNPQKDKEGRPFPDTLERRIRALEHKRLPKWALVAALFLKVTAHSIDSAFPMRRMKRSPA